VSEPLSEPLLGLDAFFAHFWRRNPVSATFAGLHSYDSVLPDWSASNLKTSAREMLTLHEELGALATTDPWEAMDIDLARATLEIRIAEDAGSHGVRGNPALWSGEAVFGMVSLMLRRFAAADTRAEHLMRRIGAIPGFLATAESTLGNTTPASWSARAIRECEGAKLLLEDIPIWVTSEKVSDEVAERVSAVVPAALNAFAEFASWLKRRSPASESSVASGPEFFDLLLARGHQSTRARADLLADAQARFVDAKASLERTATEEYGSWTAVEERLAAAHPAADSYLASFDKTWLQCFQKAQRADVVDWPHWPVHYVHQPVWAQRAAPFLYFLHYRSPAPYDLAIAHQYFVPPVDAADPEKYFKTWNHAVIKLNHVVHHGAIGHHVQNWHAYNRAMSRIGNFAAVDCASRIAMFCGGSMAEGWACYATELMEELGFLTPLEKLSEQHSRVRFLARAIVDISLHQRTMTLDEAARFYQEQVGMPEAAAKNEATKNSMFPGTGLMYWLGMQGIIDLREELKRRQGETFSLRQFHDEFLEHGSIPVPLVARRMLELAS